MKLKTGALGFAGIWGFISVEVKCEGHNIDETERISNYNCNNFTVKLTI